MRIRPGEVVLTGAMLAAVWAAIPSPDRPMTAPATVASEAQVDCTGVPVGEGAATAELARRLLAHGWFGDPRDGEERLYPPACRR